jgi:hypothetical protein
MGFASDFLSGQSRLRWNGEEQRWLSRSNARDRSLRVSTEAQALRIGVSAVTVQVQCQTWPALRFVSVSPSFYFLFSLLLFYLALNHHVIRHLPCLAPLHRQVISLTFPVSSIHLISPPLPSAIVSSSRHDHTRLSRIFTGATDPQALTG